MLEFGTLITLQTVVTKYLYYILNAWTLYSLSTVQENEAPA